MKEDIAWISPREKVTAGNLTDATQLEAGAGLYIYQRKALAGRFRKIAKEHSAAPGPIGVGECGKLITVKAAIVLVAKAAGFTYP
ncbi:MAG: hypothetical protein K1Y01_00560 [Vicinamibacteria bacterium]|nr:hypothetical protein [Vicinamibacteria bacterium]